MPLRLFHAHPTTKLLPPFYPPPNPSTAPTAVHFTSGAAPAWPAKLRSRRRRLPTAAFSSSSAPLDLTEENIEQVLAEARAELAQLFDASVNITGKAELAELDGPYVKIRLSGRFWHTRATVLARLGNYLKQRIPEILEVDIEDEKQLDDSPANF